MNEDQTNLYQTLICLIRTVENVGINEVGKIFEKIIEALIMEDIDASDQHCGDGFYASDDVLKEFTGIEALCSRLKAKIHTRQVDWYKTCKKADGRPTAPDPKDSCYQYCEQLGDSLNDYEDDLEWYKAAVKVYDRFEAGETISDD